MQYNKFIPLFFTSGTAVGQFSLSAPRYVSIGIYIKSDSEPKRLVRTTVGYKYYPTGTHTIYWDKKDDFGNTLSGSDFVAKVLDHDMSYSWQTFGNTSTLNHGGTNYNGYSRFAALCFATNKGYLGENYNEGGARKGFYFDKAVDINTMYEVLPYATDPNHSNVNDTNLETPYNCTDGTNVYWGGFDTLGKSAMYATKVSDDTNFAWSSGASFTANGGANYPNAINIVTGNSADRITGMCTNGTNLWNARGSQNKILRWTVSTGATAGSDNTTWTNPRELAYDSSNSGRIWFIHSTNTLIVATIGAGGALSAGSHTLTLSSQPILSIAIDNATSTLAILYGGTDQVVKLYSISAATPTGTHANTIGQIGGYQSTALVANDRFCFSDNTTGLTGGLSKPYLAYDGSSNLWIGDVGSERLVRFDSSRNYVDQIQIIPFNYSGSMDMANATRAFINLLEFQLDPSDGSSTFVRNFRAQLPVGFFETSMYNILRYCSTLSNGKLYATIDDYSNYPTSLHAVIFELSDAGLRNTAVYPQTTAYLDGMLGENLTLYELSSSSWAAGNSPVLKKKTITGFDGSSNPIYSSLTTVCTLDPIVAGDALETNGLHFVSGVIGNLLYVYNTDSTDTCISHIQAYNINTGALVQSTGFPTTDETNSPFLGYIGWFPPPHHYDIGNTVGNTSPRGQICGNFLVLKYYGEAWKDKQTNYHNLLYKNGLPLLQFGTNRVQSEALEVSAPETEGNGFGYRMVMYDSDTAILIHAGEGDHSAGHFWIINNISSIRERTINIITPPNPEPLPGVDLMSNVYSQYNGVLTSAGNLTISHAEGAGFRSQSGVKSWDKYDPDVTLILTASSASDGDTKYATLGLGSIDPSITNYTITGDVMMFSRDGTENSLSPYALLTLEDGAGKVIAQLTYGQVIVSNNFEIKGNSTIIYNGDADTANNLLYNTIYQWQPFYIYVDVYQVIITYAGQTVVTTLHDGTADWSDPDLLKLTVKRVATGSGVRAISVKSGRYIESTDPLPSRILSAQTLTASTIEVTYSESMTTVTDLGYTININATPATINSVSGSGTTRTFTIAETLVYSDVITIEYDSNTGDSVDINTLPLSSTTTPISVTNNIAAPFSFIQSVITYNTGYTNLLALPSFSLTAGNSVYVMVKNRTFESVNAIGDTAGNTYTLDKTFDAGMTTRIYSCHNCLGHASNIIAVGLTGNSNEFGLEAFEFTGVNGPLDSTSKGSSNTTTITSDAFTTVDSHTLSIAFCAVENNSYTWTPPAGYTRPNTAASGTFICCWKEYNSVQTGITEAFTRNSASDTAGMVLANYEI